MENSKVDITRVSKMEINLELKKYKDERGVVLFEKLLSLPTENRIYHMAKVDLGGAIKIIAVALTLAMETMNVSRKMNDFQILDLAETIVDDAECDKIALEDLMIFLQKLTRGEYPDIYEGIDQMKFMTRFNAYRDERWSEGIKIRDQRHEEYKRLGGDEWHNRANRTSPIGEDLVKHAQKLQEKKDEIALLKKENKILREQRDNQ